MYQKTKDYKGQEAQCIKRLADNAFIPFDPSNTDYQAYLAWLAAGNQPIPADAGEGNTPEPADAANSANTQE